MNRFVRVTLFLCRNKKLQRIVSHIYLIKAHINTNFNLNCINWEMALSAQYCFYKKNSFTKEVFDYMKIYLLSHDSVPHSIIDIMSRFFFLRMKSICGGPNWSIFTEAMWSWISWILHLAYLMPSGEKLHIVFVAKDRLRSLRLLRSFLRSKKNESTFRKFSFM